MIAFLVDTSVATAYLRGLHVDQIPFAASRAVNELAKDVQAAVRQSLQGSFILRAPDFVLRSVLIPHFSNKRDTPIQAQIVIGRRAAFLWKFEEGTPKVALQRDRPIAIPTTALRPSREGSVPREMYPKALRLIARRDATGVLGAKTHITRRGVPQIKGKRRTFVLDPLFHRGVKTWGVYQRFGPGPRDVKLIWTYKQRIPTPKRLNFYATAERIIRANWGPRFAQAFAQAARTAAAKPVFRRVA